MDEELLFNKNKNLVYDVIHKYFQGLQTRIPGYDFEDIVQVGNIGLWKACKKFNPSLGYKFSTYAEKAIYNEILLIIRNNKRNKILNDSISLNEIYDNKGYETELINNISHYYEYEPLLSTSKLKTYIYNNYKDSKVKLNIIWSYLFKDITQKDIGIKYGYSQPNICRILNKFKKNLKQDIERNEFL